MIMYAMNLACFLKLFLISSLSRALALALLLLTFPTTTYAALIVTNNTGHNGLFTFSVIVTSAMGVTNGDNHTLSDLDGLPIDRWESSSDIVEFGLGFLDDTLNITWDIQHLIDPHAEPGAMGGMAVLGVSYAAVGPAGPFHVVDTAVAPHVDSAGAHLDTYTLTLSGNQDGNNEITSFQVTYEGSHVIPEPTSLIVWSLLGLTLSGACWRRRKRVAS